MLKCIINTQISFALTFTLFAFKGEKKKAKHTRVHTPAALKATGTEHCTGCEDQDVLFSYIQRIFPLLLSLPPSTL